MDGKLEPYQEGPEAWDVRLRRLDGSLVLPRVRPHRVFATENEVRAWIFGFTAAPRSESADESWS
jgi:hypothetical protein